MEKIERWALILYKFANHSTQFSQLPGNHFRYLYSHSCKPEPIGASIANRFDNFSYMRCSDYWNHLKYKHIELIIILLKECIFDHMTLIMNTNHVFANSYEHNVKFGRSMRANDSLSSVLIYIWPSPIYLEKIEFSSRSWS